MIAKVLKAVIWYISRGLAVFRLKPNSKKPLQYGSFKNATFDPTKAKAWFDKGNNNIGIATGSVSNVLVIDIDCGVNKPGLENINQLVADTDIDLNTLTVKTPSGGRHLYYDTTGMDVSSITIGVGLLPGIDWRCNGGYVVAAPSVLDGVPYKIIKNVPMAPCPQKLVDYIVAAVRAKNEPAKKTKTVRAKKGSSSGAVVGTRNDECYKYAKQLLKKELSDEENKALILAFAARCVDANKQPALLDEAEALRCLASAQKSHNNHFLQEEEAVEIMNKEYAIIKNPTLIICETVDPVTNHKNIIYLTIQDLAIAQKNVRVKLENGTITTADKAWLLSPQRRQYDHIAFAPGKAYPNVYNLFVGFAYSPELRSCAGSPIEGKCSLFLKHIRKVICSGNNSHYEYVLNWIAHLFQKPDELPEVALILQGEEGTGKGKFANVIAHLVGLHALHLDNIGQLVGRFNSHLADAMFVFADESLWGGNKQEIGRLKAMITEKNLMVEPKGKTPFKINNCKRFVFATNEEWAAPVGPQDRRFFPLVVSDARRRNHQYFSAIDGELKNDDDSGYKALMHFFIKRDISKFNPRTRPYSKHSFWLKLQSTNSVLQWWFSYLNDCDQSTWRELVLTKQLFECYIEWCNSTKVRYPDSSQHFGRKLHKVAPHIVNCNPEKEGHQYDLGTLVKCRKEFESSFESGSEIWDVYTEYTVDTEYAVNTEYAVDDD